MTADSIMKHFDPSENILLDRFSCELALIKHKLGFQGAKEAFVNRISPAFSAPAHTSLQPVTGQ